MMTASVIEEVTQIRLDRLAATRSSVLGRAAEAGTLALP
jgi:hypothetical protein